MKLTLISIFSTILLNVVVAQTEEPNTSNSPGENGEIVSKNSPSVAVTEKDYRIFEQQIEKKAETVESKYFIEKEVFNSYNSTYSTTIAAVKRKIYKAGEILIEYEKSQLNNISESDYNAKYVILERINKIQDRLIFLGRQEDTREIEKKLKKLKEPVNISPVFFEED